MPAALAPLRPVPAILLSLLLGALLPAAGFSAPAEQVAPAGRGSPPVLSARAAILIDEASGRVLYEHDADEAFVPASLAKLMTLHIVYEMLDDRSIRRTDVVALSPNTWARYQAPGSTLMNLGPGQIVTVEELMKGTAIFSGNDAATALAEYVAGSTEEFVRRMNEEARFMGYSVMHFVDPSGVSPQNRVTAREFADFCRRYIELHPEALDELHSLREFDYPLAQNMPNGRFSPRETKKQYNGNYLVWDGIGVDGLKTGHLDDDNFTAAITARRGDTRLIAVLLGLSGTSLTEGARVRSEESLALLRYGFNTFSTVTVDAPDIPPVRVWKGKARTTTLEPEGPVRITLSAEERAGLSCSVLVSSPVIAPVLRGQKLGDLVYSSGGDEIARVPLFAGSDVDRSGLLRNLWDSAILGVTTAVSDTGAALGALVEGLRPQPVLSAGRSGS